MNKQGSENMLPKDFYEIAFGFIKDGNYVLNLGCGSTFIFEKFLSDVKDVVITSVDILDVKNKLGFIKNYFRKSVEEEIDLKEKFDVVTFLSSLNM